MNVQSSDELRLAALVKAYAELAPIDVDPMAVTRLAVNPTLRRRAGIAAGGWLGRGLAMLVVVIATLAAVIAGALMAGATRLTERPEPYPAVIVAKYGQLHVGWVFVYGDGRVVLMRDLYGFAPEAHPFAIAERRLTPEGLNLVRTGAVPPQSFLWEAGHCPRLYGNTPYPCEVLTESDYMPATGWSDRGFHEYKFERFAICYSRLDEPTDPMIGMALLPESAQAILLDGTRDYMLTNFDGDQRRERCSEVDAEGLDDLRRALGEPVWEGPNHTITVPVPSGATNVPGEMLSLMVLPLLPHGEWVEWGG